jgi:hypothetical protein
MIKFAPIALAATLAAFAVLPASVNAAETSQTVRETTEATAPAVAPTAGKMIYGANGQRIAAVYRVSQGSVQLILDGRLVTVPNSTLSESNGKFVTSLTKAELLRSR